MNWDEFNETDPQVRYVEQVKTDIDCPICGKKVLWDSRIELTSLPPQYQYWCPCGWSGTSYRKWREERMRWKDV